jgi:hypothetical protein
VAAQADKAASYIVGGRERDLLCSCSSLMQNIFLLDLKALQTKRILRPLPKRGKISWEE